MLNNYMVSSPPPGRWGGINFGPEGRSENFHLDGGTNANGGCQEILREVGEETVKTRYNISNRL